MNPNRNTPSVAQIARTIRDDLMTGSLLHGDAASIPNVGVTILTFREHGQTDAFGCRNGFVEGNFCFAQSDSQRRITEGGMKKLLCDQSHRAPVPPWRKHCAVLEEGEDKGLSEVPLFEMQWQVRL